MRSRLGITLAAVAIPFALLLPSVPAAQAQGSQQDVTTQATIDTTPATVMAASAISAKVKKKPPCHELRYEGKRANPKLMRLVFGDGTEVTIPTKKLKWNKAYAKKVSVGKGKKRHTVLQVIKGRNKKRQTVLVAWYDNGKPDKTADNYVSRNLSTQSAKGSFAH